MLLSFSVRNFKSILDATFFINPTKINYPIRVIYGNNNAGKSNFIQALSVFKQCFLNGINDLYMPNRLNPKLKKTTFNLNFSENSNTYAYAVQYNQKEIIEEVFYKNNDKIYSIIQGQLHFFNLSSTINLYDIYKKSCFIDNTQKNTFASKIFQLLPSFNNDINALYRHISNLCIFNEKTQQPLKNLEQILSFLPGFQIYIKKIECISNNDILTYHNTITDNIETFNLLNESSSTQFLLKFLDIMQTTFNQGGVLVVDNIDKILSCNNLSNIFNMFSDKLFNPNQSQLIATVHTPNIIENTVLRPYAISYIENSKMYGSQIVIK